MFQNAGMGYILLLVWPSPYGTAGLADFLAG